MEKHTAAFTPTCGAGHIPEPHWSRQGAWSILKMPTCQHCSRDGHKTTGNAALVVLQERESSPGGFCRCRLKGHTVSADRSIVFPSMVTAAARFCSIPSICMIVFTAPAACKTMPSTGAEATLQEPITHNRSVLTTQSQHRHAATEPQKPRRGINKVDP